MQVGQTILSVCKGVAQWKNVGKQTKQAVQQEVVKELAKTVRQLSKLATLFFCISGGEESPQETLQSNQNRPSSDRGEGLQLFQAGQRSERGGKSFCGPVDLHARAQT